MSGHLTCALKEWYTKNIKQGGSENYRSDAANTCNLRFIEVNAKNVIDSIQQGFCVCSDVLI